jgi:hypothetical protein
MINDSGIRRRILASAPRASNSESDLHNDTPFRDACTPGTWRRLSVDFPVIHAGQQPARDRREVPRQALGRLSRLELRAVDEPVVDFGKRAARGRGYHLVA